MNKIRWGILGVARIAEYRIIPAMQHSEYCNLVAIASRDRQKAVACAQKYDIPLAYGSYEALLQDPSIDAVYIPLPNHLHVGWIEKAIKAHKHVLCEKPLALTVEDVHTLIELRNSSGFMIGEAYAMLHQPRLHRLKEIFEKRELGTLGSAHGCFYLYNDDPNDIGNTHPWDEGGGGLWDVGGYPIAVGRWMFGEEPCEVSCTATFDENYHVDNHVTGWIRFPSGRHMSFACGMRFPDHTHMTFYTETHRIEVPSPYFSDDPDNNVIYMHKGLERGNTQAFDIVDQYAFECDNFVLAMQKKLPFAGSLEHTLAQTKVVLALFESAQQQKVVKL